MALLGRAGHARRPDRSPARRASRDLLDRDALDMIEGVLQVSEMQVRDIMVPRAADGRRGQEPPCPRATTPADDQRAIHQSDGQCSSSHGISRYNLGHRLTTKTAIPT